MQSDQVADDRQTEAQAFVLACQRPVRLPEPFKHERQKILANSFACVAHDNLDLGSAEIRTEGPILLV